MRLREVQNENAALTAEVTESRATLAQAVAAEESARAEVEEFRLKCVSLENAKVDAEAKAAAANDNAAAAKEIAATASARVNSDSDKLEEFEMIVEELSTNVTELETALEAEKLARSSAEANAAQLEEKLQSTVQMAADKMRQLGKENATLRAKKK